MKYIGHKSLESFLSTCNHQSRDEYWLYRHSKPLTPFLISLSGTDGLDGLNGQEAETRTVLKIKQAEAV
jgi:hypothetical protein